MHDYASPLCDAPLPAVEELLPDQALIESRRYDDPDYRLAFERILLGCTTLEQLLDLAFWIKPRSNELLDICHKIAVCQVPVEEWLAACDAYPRSDEVYQTLLLHACCVISEPDHFISLACASAMCEESRLTVLYGRLRAMRWEPARWPPFRAQVEAHDLDGLRKAIVALAA